MEAAPNHAGKPNAARRVPITAIRITDGEETQFESIYATKEAGFNPNKVSEVLKGKRGSHLGHTFFRTEDKSRPLAGMNSNAAMWVGTLRYLERLKLQDAWLRRVSGMQVERTPEAKPEIKEQLVNSEPEKSKTFVSMVLRAREVGGVLGASLAVAFVVLAGLLGIVLYGAVFGLLGAGAYWAFKLATSLF